MSENPNARQTKLTDRRDPLVRVCNLFRVDSGCEKEDERDDANEEEARVCELDERVRRREEDDPVCEYEDGEDQREQEGCYPVLRQSFHRRSEMRGGCCPLPAVTRMSRASAAIDVPGRPTCSIPGTTT